MYDGWLLFFYILTGTTIPIYMGEQDAEKCRLISNHTSSDITSDVNYRPWSDVAFHKALELSTRFQNYHHLNLLLPSIQLENLPTIPESKLKRTIEIITDSLRLYGVDGTAASFNGGKDATVVLQLYIATVAQLYHENNIPSHLRKKPTAVYFAEDSEFPAVKEFIFEINTQWDLDLKIYRGPYINKIAECLSEMDNQAPHHTCHPFTKSITTWQRHPLFLIGKRRGDPKSDNIGVWEPSSGWLKSNPFMRAHPILEWSYGEVWFFLTYFKIKYCRLYDEGYTSLGRYSETMKNELLRTEDGWTPARSLEKWSSERGGRSTPDEDFSHTPQSAHR